MSHEKKHHMEARKETAQRQLTARQEALKAQGLEDAAIQKDPAVRKIKAAIRQARRQMDRIAEFEALDQRKAEAKEQKRNAPKEARSKAAKPALQGESRRKAKREKKQQLAPEGQE